VDELERWTRPLPLMAALRPHARRTVAASLSYCIVAPGEVVAAVGQPLQAVRVLLSSPVFAWVRVRVRVRAWVRVRFRVRVRRNPNLG